MRRYISIFFKNYSFSFMKKYLGLSLILILVGYKFWYKYIFIIGLLSLFTILYFYRIPKPNTIIDSNFLFSPCFGKVMKIQKVGNNMLQISIYIGLKDPHIQYIPYDGLITKQIYKKGKFYPAHMFEKSKYNEKLIHNIQTNKGLFSIVQIGGILARSITSFVNEKEFVKQNQKLGLIGMTGSRVDLFIPMENKFNIIVEEGQRVTNKTKLLQFFNM